MYKALLLLIVSTIIPLISFADPHPLGLSAAIPLVDDRNIDNLIHTSDKLVVLITVNDTAKYGYFKQPERIQLFNRLYALYEGQVNVLVALRSYIPERKCTYASECLITRPNGS